MRNHQNLRAFQLAEELTLQVYRCTRRYPPQERYGLVNQMRRSAVSVAANIAEGAGRGSEPDFLRFLQMSFGSLKELGFYINLSQKLRILSKDRAQPLVALQDETARVLAGLIKALQKSGRQA